MAKEDEKKPTAAEKGKGKAVNGAADKKEAKKDKDGKPDLEDKKGGIPDGKAFAETLLELHGADTC